MRSILSTPKAEFQGRYSTLKADTAAAVYALRWEIELLFRELKSQLKLDDMPSGNKAATECLLYAALLTMAFGRKLLRALQVQQHSKDIPVPTFPSERWTIVMRSVALLLLALLLGPPRARLALESRLWIVLQREAPDPNRKSNVATRTGSIRGAPA